MDRLSAYAARESESDPPEDRQKLEEESTAALLEKLRISEEAKKPDTATDSTKNTQSNGEVPNAEHTSNGPEQHSESPKASAEEPNGFKNEDPVPRKRGIPENVKLYEIFYDQVTHLVNAQRLHIQDTVALLVSLSNLALYASLSRIILAAADLLQ